MSAHEHINNKQLSLFLPARELMNYTAGHTEGYSTDYTLLSKSPGVYKKKLQESKQTSYYFGKQQKSKKSLYDSIKQEGVKIPITLRFRNKENDIQIDDGHHRIVSAHDIDPNMEIPVRYKETKYQ